MKIRCEHCGVTIESKNRHDMVWCKCGKVGIDGGTDYVKISGYTGDWEAANDAVIEETLEVMEETNDR